MTSRERVYAAFEHREPDAVPIDFSGHRFFGHRRFVLPRPAYGHTGFTGTSIWIDPTTQTYIILLTNAVHPRGKGNAIGLRSKVATEVAAALNLTPTEKEEVRLKSVTGYNEAFSAARRMSVRNGSVKNGLDLLEEHGFDVLKPVAEGKKRVGLVTNQTGLDATGKRTIDVLAQEPGVSLDAIFSPEHGVTGTLDTTDINNSKDAATGVPVYSVYGGSDAARRPPAEVMKNLDAVVFDIQDAGAAVLHLRNDVGIFSGSGGEGWDRGDCARPAGSDNGVVCAGSGSRCGTRELHKLLDRASAARYDDRRTGQDVQCRAQH